MPRWKFWQKETTLKQLDPHSLAYWLVRSISERKPPFTMWRQEGMSFTDEEEAFVELSVWSYQVFTFLKLLVPKFGEEIPKIVREHFLILLDRGKKGLGDQMKTFLDAIERGYKKHEMEPIKRPGKPDEAYPVEVSIALVLLSNIAESTEAKEKLLLNLGWALDCGKIAAEDLFPSVIEEMDFRHDSVFGLQKEPPKSHE